MKPTIAWTAIATSSAASTQIVKPRTPKLARCPATITASIDSRPFFRPVDVLELEPERELVKGQPGADAEGGGDDLTPGRLGATRCRSSRRSSAAGSPRRDGGCGSRRPRRCRATSSPGRGSCARSSRMKPKFRERTTRKTKAAARAASTMCSSKKLPRLAKLDGARSRHEDDLADVAALGDERWASPALSNGKASATTGSSRPASRSASSGSITRSRLPSRSHQSSMLSPKTPLFSFIIVRLFHHGIVASRHPRRGSSASPGCCACPPSRSRRART